MSSKVSDDSTECTLHIPETTLWVLRMHKRESHMAATRMNPCINETERTCSTCKGNAASAWNPIVPTCIVASVVVATGGSEESVSGMQSVVA